MAEASTNLLKLTKDELAEAIATMPTAQFIAEGKAALDLLLKTHKVITANDKQIMDTCQQILESGKLETQEERQYFMDIMLKASKSIDFKTWAAIGTPIIIAAGAIATWIAKTITKKN